MVAAAMAEEIVDDLKNPAGHRRVERPSLPASGQGLLAATRTGPTPAGRNMNVYVGHVISITSSHLYCCGGHC